MIEDQFDRIQSLYRGKKVLITGHTGFKGSWLSFWLNSIGAEVRGFSLPPDHETNLYDLIIDELEYNSTFGDIRDYDKLSKVVAEFMPDFVFHLAAQPLVRKSYEFPIETYETNVIGTGNLLKSIKELDKACATVIVTTDKVYQNNEWHYPYRESDRLGGYDPYSSSKACTEILVDSFRNSFFHIEDYEAHGKAVATARAGNVIGGGDWSSDRIVPDIVNSLLSDTPISIRNPNAVRPWQHVLEPLGGYLLLGLSLVEKPTEFATSWNFGPALSDHLTVKDLVEISIHCWGKGEFVFANLEDQPHEAGLLKLDINKTMSQLDWHPKLNSTESIQKTIEWYKAYSSGTDAVELLENDLKQFIN